MIYGYARVSSKDQNLARQIQTLSGLGVDRIFKENTSGANLSQPVLKELLAILKPEDVTNVIIEVRSKGATIDFLDMPSYKEVDDENTPQLTEFDHHGTAKIPSGGGTQKDPRTPASRHRTSQTTGRLSRAPYSL
ncbi:recombinase family protein [Secundilactobacillus yichangensis]|uniref:recombinase family protein n=1 Tax=Secundilactobacillus yichangensis TaxID=2799580 RepID=UPI001F2F6A05|nr:recombinase family protein [Secundilactobacillus yichangensis]